MNKWFLEHLNYFFQHSSTVDGRLFAEFSLRAPESSGETIPISGSVIANHQLSIVDVTLIAWPQPLRAITLHSQPDARRTSGFVANGGSRAGKVTNVNN